MKKFAKKIALFLALALTLTLVDASAVSAASKITLKSGEAAPASVYAGHSYTLKVAGTAVKFFSSNKKVATIGMTTGKFKPVAPGTVKITAKSKKTGKAVATKSFKVLQRATAVAADQTELYLGAVGDTAKITATKTPATSTDVVKFFSADKTIATVGMTSGKVTAKAEGTTTISVYAMATKSTSKSSKYNKVATVNVYVGPYMASAVQKAVTDVELTFKADMKDVKAADFTVTNDTTKQVIAVKSATVSTTDAKVVTLSTYAELKDGATYTVAYGKTSAQFTATDGKVASLAITPTVVTVGKETPIYVVAKDANGIEVGKYAKGEEANLDFTVETSDGYVTGENALYLNSKTSTAKAKATLHTWKFETVDGVQKEVGVLETGEVTITATDAESISNFNYTVAKSAPAWTSASYKQNTTLCVGENDYNVYFNFSDASKNAITDYSGYSFSSSNEDVLLVTATNADSVSIAPIKAGTAYIIVKNATTNAVVTTLAVTVKEAAKATSLVLDKTAVTVSNQAAANDVVTVACKVLDQYGNAMTVADGDITLTKKSNPTDAAMEVASISGSDITVNAADATKGTYVYEVKYGTLSAKILSIVVKEPATNGAIGFDLGLSTNAMDAVVTDAASMNKSITINTVMTKGGIAYKALTATTGNEGDGTTYNNVDVTVEVKNSKGEVVSTGSTFAVVTDGKAVATGTYTVVAKFAATKVADAKVATFTKTTTFTITNTQLAVTFERVEKEYKESGSMSDLVNACYSFYYDGTKYGKNGTAIEVVSYETSYESATYVAFKTVTLAVPVAEGVTAQITVDLAGANTVSITGSVAGDTATETPVTEEAPATSEAPVETTEAPATSEAPVETTEAPATSEAPVETTEAPVETTEAPATSEAPVETTEAPVVSEEPTA